jgi:hypothetical protein
MTVRPGGVYNFTTVTINNSSQLIFVPGEDNSPVVMLATGDVTIGQFAAISVNGNPAGRFGSPSIGGAGGPGGFAGGNAGVSPDLASSGQGPGGGQAAATTPGAAQRGTYGAPDHFVSLIPLFGGSGGAGGISVDGGGGGGGAILIASSTQINFIPTFPGQNLITANGGACNSLSTSAGSGGAIRLVAPLITGGGTLRAVGGVCGGGVAGGDGRIRLEGATAGFTGSAIPLPSVVATPGPVSPLGSPTLANVPTLAISSIGGQPLPATTAGSFFAPDVTLAFGTANPVPVAITATNTPVSASTAISVRLIPRSGAWTDVPVTNQSGSFASSTGSADVTFPPGLVSVVQAIASFTLTGQTAMLFPLIDGEPVERVTVAATPGQASTLSMVTRSGKEVRLDQMRFEDQVRVAQAWSALKEQAN